MLKWFSESMETNQIAKNNLADSTKEKFWQIHQIKISIPIDQNVTTIALWGFRLPETCMLLIPRSLTFLDRKKNYKRMKTPFNETNAHGYDWYYTLPNLDDPII